MGEAQYLQMGHGTVKKDLAHVLQRNFKIEINFYWGRGPLLCRTHLL